MQLTNVNVNTVGTDRIVNFLCIKLQFFVWFYILCYKILIETNDQKKLPWNSSSNDKNCHGQNKTKTMKIDLDNITRIVTDIFCHNDKNCHGLKQKKSMKIDLDNITRIVTDIFCHNDNKCHWHSMSC